MATCRAPVWNPVAQPWPGMLEGLSRSVSVHPAAPASTARSTARTFDTCTVLCPCNPASGQHRAMLLCQGRANAQQRPTLSTARELQQRPTRPPVSSPSVAAKRRLAENGDLSSTRNLRPAATWCAAVRRLPDSHIPSARAPAQGACPDKIVLLWTVLAGECTGVPMPLLWAGQPLGAPVLASGVHRAKAVQQVLARHARAREAQGAVVHALQAHLHIRARWGADGPTQRAHREFPASWRGAPALHPHGREAGRRAACAAGRQAAKQRAPRCRTPEP